MKIVRREVRKTLSMISPKLASKLLFKSAFNRGLDLKKPQTLNEKLMWLKLNTYYKNALVTQCADKYAVRDYIIATGNKHLLNDLLYVWDSVEDIKWSDLPDKFVIKCNHGAGYNLICKNKDNLDVESAKRKIKMWLKEDYWKKRAETNYKYINKKIICEKFIDLGNDKLPEDYKIYCFNGEPACVMLCLERETTNPKFYYFDKNWEMLPYSADALAANEEIVIPKPAGIDEMFEYAKILSKPFPFVRADFYLIDGNITFGELTFTPGAALDNERLENTDKVLGDLLDLKKIK